MHLRLPGFARLGRCARSLGPGLITGAADDDPSGIVTYSIVGAQHGMSLLWLAWLTWPLMAAVQMMCARIGLVTGQGLGSVFKKKFPRAVVVAVCSAPVHRQYDQYRRRSVRHGRCRRELLSGLSAYFFIPLFGAGIAFAMVKCRYELIATILKWLVLSLFAYVATAFLVHPNWSEVAKATFVPALPEGTANLGSHRCRSRHHDQSLFVFLAIVAGGGRGARPKTSSEFRGGLAPSRPGLSTV